MATSKSSQLLSAVFALATIATGFEEISSDRCDCFLTNGSTSNYFSGHKFFDFRSLPDYAGVPAHIEDAYLSSYVVPTSEYFTTEEWTSTWGIQGWNNSESLAAGAASVLMVHSPNNVYIEANRDSEPPGSETFMTMRTVRLEGFQSTAEIESVDRGYRFVSMRMLARTVGAPGAITAMFTYRGAGELSRVQESDLEFRTLDPPEAVQLTNQPAYTEAGVKIDNATRNVTLPGELTYNDWAVYRMDWTPEDTTWYINGDEAGSIEFQTPRDPSILMFNSWSDGGSWTGNMTVGTEAYMHVQWIELVYNTTTPEYAKRDEGSCYNVCSIDETETRGTPVLLQGGASSLLGQIKGFDNTVSWIPLLVMIAMAYLTR